MVIFEFLIKSAMAIAILILATACTTSKNRNPQKFYGLGSIDTYIPAIEGWGGVDQKPKGVQHGDDKLRPQSHPEQNLWDTEKCLNPSLKNLICPDHIKQKLADQKVEAMMRKFYLYETFIEERFLLDGMVVSLGAFHESLNLREFKDICDSLLFSSLRFYSLDRLGFKRRAARAWGGILRAYKDGYWTRHPGCREHALSRDMLVGLLIALSRQPDGSREIILDLYDRLNERKGFFSPYNAQVSFLTPSVGRALRKLADSHGVSNKKAPFMVKNGFDTTFVETHFVKKGYQSHLIGLLTVLEIDSYKQHLMNNKESPIRPKKLFEKWPQKALKAIASDDPLNLFFRWQLKEAEFIDRYSSINQHKNPDYLQALLEEKDKIIDQLLDSKWLFPNDTPPSPCLRHSDYLWQIDSKDWHLARASFSPRTYDEDQGYSKRLSKDDGLQCPLGYWAPVDFLFMSALLFDSIDLLLPSPFHSEGE